MPALAVARAAADAHLALITPRLAAWGWTWAWVDDVRLRVDALGVRADGATDPYVLELDVATYDVEPPRVRFVLPDPFGQRPAASSAWWPAFEGSPPFQFALHHVYPFDNSARSDQLVCFSQSRDYYYSHHSPAPGEQWEQGRHTLASSLSRLHEVLSPPYYRGPSGADLL